MKRRKVLILVSIIVVLLFIIIIGSVGVKIINANPINYLKPVNWEKAILEFSKVISIDNKYEEDIEELNLTEDSNLSEESLDKSNEVIDEVNNDKIDSEVEQIIPEEERKTQEKIIINLIVEDFVYENGYTYINADEVYWEWVDFIPGYEINGIDDNINKYKLSYNCTFGKKTIEPTDPEQGEYINFDEFKNEIVKYLDSGYPPRTRLCVAEIVKDEIVKISTVYTP